MNPSVKFVLVTVSMLVLSLFFNPWTPLLFWLSIFFLQLTMSRTNWKLWLLFMIPFSIGAFGYLWTTVVFGADTGGTIIWSFAGIDVTGAQWAHALSLAFRVMAFSTLSLLFAFTTDPVKFILSLMQQLKLSPKLAYGVMVGYQFLPVMKDEFIQIQQAQRLRGAEIQKYSWKRLVAIRRVLIPMLTGAVRKAERSAFAMEARGFTGKPRSAYYRPIRLRRLDVLMSGIFMTILLVSCLIGSWLS
ncbi:cobalt transporter [Planococcus versutus]|uniref:Cobalt transporter n=2 Tax=Planococcus versutus TaxID=1302659 RepID=A0A1B1S4Z8_9BACL|nr:cobalt transporter [Planococcus versutus]